MIVVVITSNLGLGKAPGNVPLASKSSALPRDSVINVSQTLTLDRDFLEDPIAELPTNIMVRVDHGLALALDLPV